jgi:methyl-accepting chemotaxis protein
MSIINKLVEESKNMDSKLEVQKDIIYNTSNSFTEIAELVKEITPKVSGIENVLVDISYNKDLIVDTVCELAEEIKNTSNSLEQVNDSSVELARAAEKVNNSSDILLDKADELIEKVRQFRIEQEEFNDEVSLNTEELNLNESQYIETLDVMAEEEIRESVVNLEYAVDEEIALDLLLEENLVDSNPSLLKKLEVGVRTESFREGYSNVTDVKDYTKLEKQKEYEELNEYNVI